MPEYKVTWRGHVREVYFVEAESEQEAREKWMDGSLDLSESYDGEVDEVEEV